MPLDRVIDPTGAGDAFAGGFFGYLDSHADDPFDEAGLRRAAAYGSVWRRSRSRTSAASGWSG